MSILNLKNIFHKKEKTDAWDKVIKFCLYLIVFLIPLFFLPFNTDPQVFNKMILFSFLVFIASILYLLKIIIKKQGVFRRSFLDILFIILFVIFLISTIFSLNPYTSFFGLTSHYTETLSALILFLLFFYLLIDTVREAREILKFIIIFIVSCFILLILGFFQIKGIYLWPYDFTKNTSFSLLISSITIIAVFLSFSCFVLFSLIIYLQKHWQKILALLFFIVNFLFLFLIDRNIAWYGLAAALFVFLLLISFRSKELKVHWILAPTIFFIIVILMLFINSQAITKITLTPDVNLDHKTSWQIAAKSFSKSPVFGSGPETFSYNFEKYRTVNFNNSTIWSLRFAKASDQWSQLLTTTGILGFSVFLIISLFYLVFLFKYIINNKKTDLNWFLSALTFSSWMILLVLSFFIAFNFILSFLWWLLVAFGVILMNNRKVKEISIDFKKSVYAPSIFIFILLILIAFGFTFSYYEIKFWLADYNFSKASKAIAKTEDLTKVRDYLNKSIKYNPQKSDYYFTMAQSYLTEIQLEAVKDKPDINKIQNLLKQCTDDLTKAVDMDKNNPIVYENKALIFEALKSFLQGADEQVISSYQSATALEPNNPMLYFNLASAELTRADSVLQTAKTDEGLKKVAYDLADQAINDFNKSKNLKEGMIDAEYNIALALELKGNRDEAITKMKNLADQNPGNANILYGLGLMYFNGDKLDQALEIFNKAISLQPNYSNAHWQIGLIYEKKGEKDKAIAEFELVQKLNPVNASVKQKLDELKGNKPAENK